MYSFWWTGDVEALRSANLRVDLAGPGGRRIKVEFSHEWLGLDAKLPVPLYVGKTAGSLWGRLGQHLMLGTPKRFVKSGWNKTKAPTTSCQLRAGVERMFPKEIDPIPFMLDNVGMSFVDLPNDKSAAARFYLEDLAIGLMRPVLNVDVER